MKLSRLTLASIVAALMVSLNVTAKKDVQTAYMFGVAGSFNDSTVYFTPVQEVDSAWIYTKSKVKFLGGRENYSYQLRDFLETKGEKNRTCAIFFGTNHKKVEKQWEKIHNKYTAQPKKKKDEKGGTKPPYQVKTLDNGEFAFQPIAPNEEVKAKPAKKEKKQGKPGGKPGNGPGGPGGPGGQPGGQPGGAPGGQPPMGM